MNEWKDVNEELPTVEYIDRFILVIINGGILIGSIKHIDGCYFSYPDEICFNLNSKKWIKNRFYGDITHWMVVPHIKK